MKVITICNQKGGVGKTTTTVNAATSLAVQGQKVLVIDMDPQANAGSALGVNKHLVEKSIYHALIGQQDVSSIIVKSEIENLDVLPSNRDLSGAEVELISAFARESKLKKVIGQLEKNYDFVLIDCPPSLNLLTINALNASDEVLIPVQCEYYALEGISELVHTIDLIKESLNPSLKIGGILMTMFDPRNNLSHQVFDEVKGHFKEKVFQSVIPRSVKLSEAPSHGVPIELYEPKSKGAEAYRKLGQEMIQRAGQLEKGGLVLVHNM